MSKQSITLLSSLHIYFLLDYTTISHVTLFLLFVFLLHIVFHTFLYSILPNQASYSTPQSLQSTTLLSQMPNITESTTINDNIPASTVAKEPTDNTEAPKSPPKWPLRPGVLVHVKEDTKEQLHAVRIQSPNRSKISLNTSLTPSQSSEVEQINTSINNLSTKNPFRVPRCDSDRLNEVVSRSSNNDELIKFINSKLLQRILRKLKLRRINIKEASEEEEEDDATGDGSSFKRRNDYRFRIQSKTPWKSNWDTWAWFSSNKSTRSSKNLVDNNNHINGIECTENGKKNERNQIFF